MNSKMKQKNPESKIQQACITWFALQYPQLWDNKRLHSIPNGGKRNVITASILKAEGAVSGVWDLHLTIPRGLLCGLFIEVKAGKNGLTVEQKAFKESHKTEYAFAVCYSLEDFMRAIKEYLCY